MKSSKCTGSGGCEGDHQIVLQYAENNAILLLGCTPGYKQDDIHLLPSSTTKKAVWLLYEESAAPNSIRLVAHTTFYNVWRNFLGHVVVCKPMTDLCATCQRNSAAIICSCNMTEEEKSRCVLSLFKLHCYSPQSYSADSQGSRSSLVASNV